jgi:hypothetical protein
VNAHDARGADERERAATSVPAEVRLIVAAIESVLGLDRRPG